MLNKIIVSGLIVLLIIISARAYSQKCKYNYNRKDPITGKESKGTTRFKLQNWGMLVLTKNDNQYSVAILFMHEGNITDLISFYNSIVFKLENGESINISRNEIKEIFSNSRFFNAFFNISDYDLHKIASSPLTEIKISIGPYKYDESYPIKKGKSFQNKAKCILQ